MLLAMKFKRRVHHFAKARMTLIASVKTPMVSLLLQLTPLFES